MELIPPKDCELCGEALASLSPDNCEVGILHRVITADGVIRWQEWSNCALFDEHGVCKEIQAVGRDVTERVLMEKIAKESAEEARKYHQNLEAIFQSIGDAIITVDNNLQIINSNDGIHNHCGEAHEMTEGRALLDISGGEIRPCIKVLLQTLKTGKPVSEYRVECSKGVSPNNVMLLNSAPLKGSGDEIAGAVLVIRDVTRQVNLERRLGERSFENMIGQSPEMYRVYAALEQLVDLDTTVLITGESGTGKELIADALHYFGARDSGPLVKVNCAALPESLLESELFGHVQGAFTGAVRDKIGRFQAAEGGTIFLDEIGDISPAIQLKLLRVLEQKEYERVGDSTTYKADVRVLAATNMDLREYIQKGLFREELFYRLQVMDIHLPPLRDRTGDVSLLTDHFVQLFRTNMKKDIRGVEDAVRDIFMRYTWPGNVRELKHTIERACILCPAGMITLVHLPPEMLEEVGIGSQKVTSDVLTQEMERGVLLRALEQSKWNKTLCARMLGISRPTLYRRMNRFNIE